MWEADAVGAGDAEQRLESGHNDFRQSIGGVFIGFSERGCSVLAVPLAGVDAEQLLKTECKNAISNEFGTVVL